MSYLTIKCAFLLLTQRKKMQSLAKKKQSSSAPIQHCLSVSVHAQPIIKQDNNLVMKDDGDQDICVDHHKHNCNDHDNGLQVPSTITTVMYDDTVNVKHVKRYYQGFV